MKEDLLKQLLESVLGKSKSARGGEEAVFTCPSCNHHKKKLTLNLSTQKFQCWVCGYKGHRAFRLLKAVSASPKAYDLLKDIDSQYSFKKQTTTKVPSGSLHLPQGVTPIMSSSAILSKHALHYLNQRGITAQDVVKYDLHYCEEGPLKNMVVIPSYDKDGKLNFFTGRSYYKDSSFKHKNPKVSKDIIGFELFINWDEPITIVEGAFDAIAVKRNAIPLFGKIILDNLKKKIIEKNVRDIYIALDTDAREKALDICQYFTDNGINVYLIELGEKDPSDIGYVEMVNKKQATGFITGSSLMLKKLGSMFG